MQDGVFVSIALPPISLKYLSQESTYHKVWRNGFYFYTLDFVNIVECHCHEPKENGLVVEGIFQETAYMVNTLYVFSISKDNLG